MGVVNILKTLAQSSGPSVTGILAGRDHFWVAFVVAGSLKAAYDLMLLAFFGGRVKPRSDDLAENSSEIDTESTSRSQEEAEPTSNPERETASSPAPRENITRS